MSPRPAYTKESKRWLLAALVAGFAGGAFVFGAFREPLPAKDSESHSLENAMSRVNVGDMIDRADAILGPPDKRETFTDKFGAHFEWRYYGPFKLMFVDGLLSSKERGY